MSANRCSIVLAVLGALLGACGSSSTSTTLACEPVCPSGTHCTESGCVPDVPVSGGDAGGAMLDLAGCQPACAGATPYCNGTQCVACRMDADCPAGQVCAAVAATAVCVPGCQDDAPCKRLSATHACCGGACVDTASDVVNCGSCGGTCIADHQTGVCSEGQCAAGACQAPWGDCDHDPANGCEVNLHRDALHCGGCGMKCAIPHATAACSNGCYIAACTFGFDDCNDNPDDGCEASVLSDIKSCGGCGKSCNRPPHTTMACINASCQVVGCDPGYADCDGNPANGCETPVAADNSNCGACKSVCMQGLICRNSGCTCPQCNIPNAKSACVNLVCTFDSCLPGFGDCDADPKNGCEVDLTSDRANCGTCANACGPKNCLNGMCVDSVVFDTHNFKGYTEYPLDPEQCRCCGFGVTTKQTADAFCKLAGMTISVSSVTEMVVGSNCYCWNCTQANMWTSNCCGGQAARPLITKVTCQ